MSALPDDLKIQTKVVDLGFAVARIRKDLSCVKADGSPRHFTTLTLMSPADTNDCGYEPPQSCTAFMNEEQLKALIEALS